MTQPFRHHRHITCAIPIAADSHLTKISSTGLAAAASTCCRLVGPSLGNVRPKQSSRVPIPKER
jgi:hypothetical protein